MRIRCNVVRCIAVVVIALTSGGLCSHPAAASGIPVGPGITYFPPALLINSSTELTSGGTDGADGYGNDVHDDMQAVHVVRIARDNPYVLVQASLARERVGGLESVLTQALRQHAPTDNPRQTVVAAVNADFFASAPVSGIPIGIHVHRGEIVTSPADRPAFGVGPDGRPVIGVPVLQAAVWRNEALVGSKHKVGRVPPDENEMLMQAPIDAVNRPQNGLTLYTPRFGTATPPLEGTVVTVRGIVEPLHSGTMHTGIVSRIETFDESTLARVDIPRDGVVFAARGPAQAMMDELTTGEWLSFSAALAPPFADIVDAVAGWPVLLHGGERQALPAREPLVAGRHPRTAVGFNDDELIIVTADGRQPGYAKGMTLFELTDLLVALGATDAINLDGGGSTTMVVRPPGGAAPVLANVPSDGHQRGVANALLVMSAAPAANLTTLHVQPAAPAVLRGAAVPVTVTGQDRHNNPVPIAQETVAWQWDTNGQAANPFAAGSVDFMFESTSDVPLTVRLTATVGPVSGMADVDIVDTVATLQPAADIVNIAAGDTAPLTVYAYDEAGRSIWVEPEQLHWTVTSLNDAGTPTVNGASGNFINGEMPATAVIAAAAVNGTTPATGIAAATGQAATGRAATGLAAAEQVQTAANAGAAGVAPASEDGGAARDATANADRGGTGNPGASVTGTTATVDASGHVTGQMAGQAIVYARLGDAVAATRIFVDKPPLLIADFSADDVGDEWFADVVRAQARLAQVTPPESLRAGRASLRLVYDLGVSPGGTAAAYVQAATPIPIPELPEAIGVWVYGKGNGHWLRGNYIDGAGTRQVLDFTTVGGLNWTGWRLVTAPVPPDAVLPISLERIYVVETHQERQTKGELYFDRVVALYKSR